MRLHAASYPIGGVGRRLALDDTRVYWARDELVWAVPKDGGDAVVVAPTDTNLTGYVGGIAIDDTAVYWNVYGNIWRAPKP